MGGCLYVNIKKSWWIQLSFLTPFFYKWESFSKSSGIFNTQTTEELFTSKFLILEYELIKGYILPEIKKGLDILIELEENVFFSKNWSYMNPDIQIFYHDICKVILDTIFN